jgi:RNA polymerase sigma factor for flagellar operon FliA
VGRTAGPTAARDEALTPFTKRLAEEHHEMAMKIGWEFWRKLPPGRHDPADLVSVATWGLVDATLRWTPYCAEQGYSHNDTQWFPGFAAKSIRGALLDYLRAEDHVTRTVRDEAREINGLLSQGSTRPAAAEALGISERQLGNTLAAVAASPKSLTDLDEDSVMDNLESIADANYLLEAFADIIEALPYNQQAVLALRYYANIQLSEIGRCLNLKDSAVLKLHTESITYIKSKMEQVATGQAD